jgi:drug/metabolite transporter (DMT)-like permease
MLSVLGAAWIGLGDLELSGMHLAGDALAILGAVFAAGYLICGRAARKYSTLEDYLRWVYGVASLWLVVYALIFGGGLLGISLTGLFWTAVMAIACQVVGHSLLNLAVRLYPAHLVTMALLGEGLLGAGWAALVVADYPTTQWFQGAPLIFAGLVVALTSQRENGGEAL